MQENVNHKSSDYENIISKIAHKKFFVKKKKGSSSGTIMNLSGKNPHKQAIH